MAEIFVDTAGWAQLLGPSEPYQAVAASIYARALQRGSNLVTTNYVITELVALITSPLRVPRRTIISLVGDLKVASHVEIVHVDPTLHEQAWQLLTKRPDKNWSLVDCASFVVMQQRSIQEALTTDHHFEQAGFTNLLKP
jgi:predicted nucleic acid-binding protein